MGCVVARLPTIITPSSDLSRSRVGIGVPRSITKAFTSTLLWSVVHFSSVGHDQDLHQACLTWRQVRMSTATAIPKTGAAAGSDWHSSACSAAGSSNLNNIEDRDGDGDGDMLLLRTPHSGCISTSRESATLRKFI